MHLAARPSRSRRKDERAVLFPGIDGMAQAVIDVGLDGVAQDDSPGKTGSAGRASRSSMIVKGRALAPEHGRRRLTGLRSEYRWEAP